MLEFNVLNPRDFQIGERVFYRFSHKHPYEKQPLNDSKEWGKGMVIGFGESGFIIVKTNSCNGSKEKPWMLFKENELLCVKDYYNRPEGER